MSKWIGRGSARTSAMKIRRNQGDEQDLWTLLWAFDHGRGLATRAVLKQEYEGKDLSGRYDDIVIQMMKELK